MNTKRIRDYGITIGSLPPGKKNAITDIPGVTVGHCESPSALCPLEKKMPLQIFPESLWAIVPLILPGTKQE